MWKRINEKVQADRIGRQKLLFSLKVTGKVIQISETIFYVEKPETS